MTQVKYTLTDNLILDDIENDKLYFYFYFANDDYLIPEDWHSDDVFKEMEMRFDIADITNSLIEANEAIIAPNHVAKENKHIFDKYKEQLLHAIETIDSIKYFEDFDEIELEDKAADVIMETRKNETN